MDLFRLAIVLASLVGIGHLLGGWFRTRDWLLSEWLLIRITLAWAAVVALGMILGCVGFFTRDGLLLGLGFFFLLVYFLARRGRRSGRWVGNPPENALPMPAALLCAGYLSLEFLNFVTFPTFEQDTLNYYLGIPIRWLQDGHFWQFPGELYELRPYQFANHAIVNAVFLSAAPNRVLTCAPHFVYQAVIILALYAILRRVTGHRTGEVFLAPLLVWLTLDHFRKLIYGSGRSDLAVIAGSMVLLWSFIRFRESSSIEFGLLAALGFGLAAGSKHSGLFVAGVWAFLGLPFIGFDRIRRICRQYSPCALIGVGILAASFWLFWVVRNIYMDGNPFPPVGLPIPFISMPAMFPRDRLMETTLLSHFLAEPSETLATWLTLAPRVFGSACLLLLFPFLLLPVLFRLSSPMKRRAATYLAAVAVSAWLLYMVTPFTGAGIKDGRGYFFMRQGVRFLYPGIVAGIAVTTIFFLDAGRVSTFLLVIVCAILVYLGLIPNLVPGMLGFGLAALLLYLARTTLSRAAMKRIWRICAAAVFPFFVFLFYGSYDVFKNEDDWLFLPIPYNQFTSVIEYLDESSPTKVLIDGMHILYPIHGRQLQNEAHFFSEKRLRESLPLIGLRETAELTWPRIAEILRRKDYEYLLVTGTDGFFGDDIRSSSCYKLVRTCPGVFEKVVSVRGAELYRIRRYEE